MKPLISFLLLLQTLSLSDPLYGMEVDMVRFELIYQNKYFDVNNPFYIVRIDENKNLYTISYSYTTPYPAITKFNANELLWSKTMEQEPLEPQINLLKFTESSSTRLIDIQYFKNNIYAFTVYAFKGKDEKSDDRYNLYRIYEIAKYNTDGELIDRQAIFKSKIYYHHKDPYNYWSNLHIYNNKIYFFVGDERSSIFVGVYDLTNDKIKPIETIKLDDYYALYYPLGRGNKRDQTIETIKHSDYYTYSPIKMEVGEYGIYIVHNTLLKKFDLEGNPLWAEEIKIAEITREGKKRYINKIIADKDLIFMEYEISTDYDDQIYLIVYDHNKKLLWQKIEQINSFFNTIDTVLDKESLYTKFKKDDDNNQFWLKKYDKKNGKILFETKIDYQLAIGYVMMPHKNGILINGLGYPNKGRMYANYNHQNQLTFRAKVPNDYFYYTHYDYVTVEDYNKDFLSKYFLYNLYDDYQTGYIFKPHFTKCTLPSDSFDINAFTSLGKGWHMLASGDHIKDLCVLNQFDFLYLVDYSKPDNLNKIRLNSPTTPKTIDIKPFEGFLVYNELPDDLEVIYDKKSHLIVRKL